MRNVFTVFTPTYNRANTLSRVYESLKAQTFRDFEWLIVDDGSTDSTRDIVREWQEGRLVGDKFDRDILDADEAEMYLRYRPRGEKDNVRYFSHI